MSHLNEILMLARDGSLEAARATRLLFYVDDPLFADGRKYGTRFLQHVLTDAGYTIAVRQRREQPLTAEFLDEFAEIWFFLKSEAEEDALTEGEVRNLRAWMDAGGGVLITGDHARLGCAVGEGIPRAGQMRVWADEPGETEDTRSNNSTTRPLYTENEERDAEAQHVYIIRNASQGRHEIFATRMHVGVPDRLPDHAHEGEVKGGAIAPSENDDQYPEEWFRVGASRSQAPPPREVIARGVNWQRGDLFDLMAAWDGFPVQVGRIVADASWHHYVDYNVEKLHKTPDWALIQGLYRSLADWLLPVSRRNTRIALALRSSVNNKYVVDYEHNSARRLGTVTLEILERQLDGPLLGELKALVRAELGGPFARADVALPPEFDIHLAAAYASELRRVLDTTQPMTVEPGTVLTRAKASYGEELEARADAWGAYEKLLP